jgi:FkbM family methyltransferase
MTSRWPLLDTVGTRSGGVVLDIGATIGWYSCIFARAMPNIKVLAFEPDPVSHDLLRKNVDLNGLHNVTPVQAAVSSTAGTARFYQYQGGNRGQNSLMPTYAAESATVDVLTVVLDDYLAEQGLGSAPMRFIKLDTSRGTSTRRCAARQRRWSAASPCCWNIPQSSSSGMAYAAKRCSTCCTRPGCGPVWFAAGSCVRSVASKGPGTMP